MPVPLVALAGPILGGIAGAIGTAYAGQRISQSIQTGAANAGRAVADSINAAGQNVGGSIHLAGVEVGSRLAAAGLEASDLVSKRCALAFLTGVDQFSTSFNVTTLAATDQLCRTLSQSTNVAAGVFLQSTSAVCETLRTRADAFGQITLQASNILADSVRDSFRQASSLLSVAIVISAIIMPFLNTHPHVYTSLWQAITISIWEFLVENILTLIATIVSGGLVHILYQFHHQQMLDRCFTHQLAIMTATKTTPRGSTQAYTGLIPPDGWLLCDGSPLNLALHPEYTALATLLGDTYDPVVIAARAAAAAAIAAAPGGILFPPPVIPGGAPFLPDLRGRVIIGCGAAPGLTARPLGSVCGVEQHQLTVAQLPRHVPQCTVHDPQHTHQVHDPGHAHTWHSIGGNFQSGPHGGYSWYHQIHADVATTTVATGISLSTSPTNITVTAAPIGGDQHHENMQPSQTLNYIIKW